MSLDTFEQMMIIAVLLYGGPVIVFVLVAFVCFCIVLGSTIFQLMKGKLK